MRASVILFTLLLLPVLPGFAQTAGPCTDAAEALASFQGQLPDSTWQWSVDWLQMKYDGETDESLRCQWESDMANHLAEVVATGPPDSTASKQVPRPQPPAASTIYAVPFASSNNRLELTVKGDVQGLLEARVVQAPDWIRLPTEVHHLEHTETESILSFSFDVAEAAPIGEVGSLVVAFRSAAGLLQRKEIRLQVEAPKEVALQKNYPNPFNPTTTIGYQLPQVARVSLRIYDVLGRELALLVHEERPAGHHEAVWDASRYASGLYIYRLRVEDDTGTGVIKQGTMLLVK